ncbi:MAG: DUF4199 domain-containing protein [Sphingobacteriaceae bacterium]|nr:DUF4199 domain-containing protein [Sphingobacteriaceae bacterium]
MDSGLKRIRKQAFSNGFILGAVLLIADILILYALAYSKSVSLIFFSYLLVVFIIPLTAAIILIRHLRKKIGGYWNLRQATSGIFIIFISAYLISSAGSFLFIQYMKPDIMADAKRNSVNVFGNFFEKIDADPDEADKLIESVETQFDSMSKSSAGSVFSNLLSSIIILFVAALIFGAIFKREEPVLLNSNTPES